MEIGRRDAFDLALVAVAIACIVSYLADESNPQTAIDALVDALTSVSPVAYLVLFGGAGVLFLAWAMLYLPSQQRP